VQDPTKFTQIWIFGLKTNHLATLQLGGRWCPDGWMFIDDVAGGALSCHQKKGE
jgi:hypothetical protein